MLKELLNILAAGVMLIIVVTAWTIIRLARLALGEGEE